MATLAELSERLEGLQTNVPYIMSDFQDLIHKHRECGHPWIVDFYEQQKTMLELLVLSCPETSSKLMDTFQEVGEVFKRNHMEDDF